MLCPDHCCFIDRPLPSDGGCVFDLKRGHNGPPDGSGKGLGLVCKRCDVGRIDQDVVTVSVLMVCGDGHGVGKTEGLEEREGWCGGGGGGGGGVGNDSLLAVQRDGDTAFLGFERLEETGQCLVDAFRDGPVEVSWL